MNRTKSVIIKKKSENGDPSKIYSFMYKGADGSNCIYIQHRRLSNSEHHASITVKRFKNLFLLENHIALRLDTFNQLAQKLARL